MRIIAETVGVNFYLVGNPSPDQRREVVLKALIRERVALEKVGQGPLTEALLGELGKAQSSLLRVHMNPDKFLPKPGLYFRRFSGDIRIPFTDRLAAFAS